MVGAKARPSVGARLQDEEMRVLISRSMWEPRDSARGLGFLRCPLPHQLLRLEDLGRGHSFGERITKLGP